VLAHQCQRRDGAGQRHLDVALQGYAIHHLQDLAAEHEQLAYVEQRLGLDDIVAAEREDPLGKDGFLDPVEPPDQYAVSAGLLCD
jgi:hypothetical protein